MVGIRVFLFAILIDLLIGDTVWVPHPVVLMGKGIQRLEEKYRKLSGEDEKKLKSLATEFIEKMLGEKLEDRKVNIKRQYQKIDVLLEIQNKTEFITKGNNINPIVDMYVIIEDKVGIGLHSNEIERYRELITEKMKKILV